MSKRPAFLLYTGDWLKDTALRSCSIEARGMWMDMLCHMHDCEPYGHLKVNHKVILIPNLASMVGVNVEDAQRMVKELIDAGVCQQKEDGTLYSKRMVKDEETRLKRAMGGHLGGNPKLNPKPKKTKKDKVNLPIESESVNESISSIVYNTLNENFSNSFFEVWQSLCASKKWKDKQRDSLEMSFKKLKKYKEPFSIELMESAIMGGYQGVVFPETNERYKKWLEQNASPTQPTVKRLSQQ